MMYKYANNILPPVINDMYTTNSDVHNYTTRQKHLLHVNNSNINIYSKSFANTSARIWNGMLCNPKLRSMFRYPNSKCLQKCICKNTHFIPNIQNRTLI